MIPYVNEKMRLNKHRNVFIPRNKDLYEQFKPKAQPYAAGESFDSPMTKNQCYQSLIDQTIAKRKAEEQKKSQESVKPESQASKEPDKGE